MLGLAKYAIYFPVINGREFNKKTKNNIESLYRLTAVAQQEPRALLDRLSVPPRKSHSR